LLTLRSAFSLTPEARTLVTSGPYRFIRHPLYAAGLLIGLVLLLDSLSLAAVAIFLAEITELGGKVIFGTLIIVSGIFLARIISGLVGSSTGEDSYAQALVRYAIIALFTAIGLTFMGLADEIVMLAFGLILGSAAVAVALAFGLGGRDAAARLLERYVEEHGGPPAPRAAPRRIRQAPAADDDQPPLV